MVEGHTHQTRVPFELEDATLEYTDEALLALAELALAKDTGVRAVRAILENILVDVLYELPDPGQKVRLVIHTHMRDSQILLMGFLRQDSDQHPCPDSGT